MGYRSSVANRKIAQTSNAAIKTINSFAEKVVFIKNTYAECEIMA
jgi:hypothetical protein